MDINQVTASHEYSIYPPLEMSVILLLDLLCASGSGYLTGFRFCLIFSYETSFSSSFSFVFSYLLVHFIFVGTFIFLIFLLFTFIISILFRGVNKSFEFVLVFLFLNLPGYYRTPKNWPAKG